MSNFTAKFFAEEVRRTRFEISHPVRSLFDKDFYKDTTGQVILKYHPDEIVTFELIVRSKGVKIAEVVSERELREALDYARSLRVRKTDLYYMRGIDLYERYMFKEPYLRFLESLALPPYDLKAEDGNFKLRFTGRWCEVTHWETIALAIISELYYRSVLRMVPEEDLEKIYQRAMDKLRWKLERVLQHPGIVIADFSHRRRHSFLWQKYVVKTCKETLGKQFSGTSNTYLAFALDLVPIGTNPHEGPMVITALQDHDDDMRHAPYRFLEYWQETYGQGLRVFLPDTYVSEFFFENAPKWLLTWKGQRQDSGLPIEEGERYMRWLEANGEDPAKHLTIFSDGLDVDPMIEIDQHFGARHPHAFGVGTLLGNDFRKCYSHPLLEPISMVCKVVEANGRPVVKLSNNINKATGPKKEIERYIRIFGSKSRSIQEVWV